MAQKLTMSSSLSAMVVLRDLLGVGRKEFEMRGDGRRGIKGKDKS